MKPSLLLISGWAHGVDAIAPLGHALSNQFNIQLLTGAQALREQKIPPCDIIITGSMGGLLAVDLLPDCCKKLVLISSTAKFCSDGEYRCGTPEKIVQRMILQLKNDPITVLNAFFKNVHFPHPAPKSNPDYLLNELVNGLEYLLTSDIRKKVPTLEIPVLLLHGVEDRIIPPSAAEWLHAHLPNSRLAIFKNAGHALPAHQFDKTIEKINQFI